MKYVRSYVPRGKPSQRFARQPVSKCYNCGGKYISRPKYGLKGKKYVKK